MLFVSEALIISPEKREWIYSPTTKVVAAQLLMADKVLPQSISLTVFWIVQYVILPELYGTQVDFHVYFKSFFIMLLLVLASNYH